MKSFFIVFFTVSLAFAQDNICKELMDLIIEDSPYHYSTLEGPSVRVVDQHETHHGNILVLERKDGMEWNHYFSTEGLSKDEIKKIPKERDLLRTHYISLVNAETVDIDTFTRTLDFVKLIHNYEDVSYVSNSSSYSIRSVQGTLRASKYFNSF